MAHDLAILTPEKTVLTVRVAGLGSRAVAHLIDVFLLIMLLYGIAFGLSVLALVAPIVSMIGIFVVFAIGIFIPILYFTLCEIWMNGQTFGKKAAKIRVRMADGTGITPSAALVRNLIRLADFFPATYLVGVVSMFANPRSQRLGDLAAGTIVVHESLTMPSFRPTPYSRGIHRFEEYIGELRGMNADDYAALRLMCDRFPQFPVSVQEKMLREIWRPIAQRVGVPETPGVHPIYLAEAAVMKFGRERGLM